MEGRHYLGALVLDRLRALSDDGPTSMCVEPLPARAHRVAMLTVLFLSISMWSLLAQSPARAVDCARLGASEEAPVDQDTAWAKAVFESIVRAEKRVDPSATRPTLRIIHNLGTLAEGPGHGASAWYCRGSDTVFLSRSLIAYAALARSSDGSDFLAFAIAHELAHRRFDRDAHTTARPLAGNLVDVNEYCAMVTPLSEAIAMEARADHRAVFLLAMAHSPEGRRFTPLSLSHYRTLETFLAAERGLPSDCAAIRVRVARVEQALTRMARVRELYEAAVAVAFHRGGTGDLTTLAAELAPESAWDAVPELWVLRAQAHLAAAAGHGGWCPPDLAALGLPICSASCAAIFPSHTRLAPPPTATPLRSATSRMEEVAAARAALLEARRLGLSAAELGGAEACLAFAERDPNRALSVLARVPPHPETAAMRAKNRRLFERQRAVLEAMDPLELGAFEPEAPSAALAGSVPLHELRALSEAVAKLDCGAPGRCTRIGQTELAVLFDTSAEVSAKASPGPSIDAWRAACDVSSAGIGDDGRALFIAQCPRWDAAGVVGWTLVADPPRVLRATRVRRP